MYKPIINIFHLQTANHLKGHKSKSKRCGARNHTQQDQLVRLFDGKKNIIFVRQQKRRRLPRLCH
jgi:hypothetical protein